MTDEFMITETFDKPLDNRLKAYLSVIKHETEEFWRNATINHFTNHGIEHSEWVLRKIGELSQELSDKEPLTRDEVFIVSAAAYLYEIGMQSTKLEPVLGPHYDEPLTDAQKELIRAKKHELTYTLIMDSVRTDGDGTRARLGLTGLQPDYVRAIAAICRYCTKEQALNAVPLKMSVLGLEIRSRLLTALLRLADQLHIGTTRVILPLLQKADIPIGTKTRWWAYHYAQALPLEHGQIRFDYRLPVTHRPFWGHIRALIEPGFDHANNPEMDYLREHHHVNLIRHPNPNVNYDQPEGFLFEMSEQMIMYLRQEVKPLSFLPEEPQIPSERVGKRGLVLLDYENFVLQLGLMGHFLPLDEIKRNLIDLIGQVSSKFPLDRFDRIAVGHWSWPELEEDKEMVSSALFELLDVGKQDDSASVIKRELDHRFAAQTAHSRIIFITPPPALARTVEQTDEKTPTYNWIANTDDATIYRVLGSYTWIEDLLNLPKVSPPESSTLLHQRLACILKLDQAAADAHTALSDERVSAILSSIPDLVGQPRWWKLWLLNKGILQWTDNRKNLTLNPEHDEITKVRQWREQIISTFFAPERSSQGSLSQDELLASLPQRERSALIVFLLLLKDEDLLFIDPTTDPPSWQLNAEHPAVLSLNADQHLRLLFIGIDHFMATDGHLAIHEHTIMRHAGEYVGRPIAEAIYNMACHDKVIKREERHIEGRVQVNVTLDITKDIVRQALLSRDALLDKLYNTPEGYELDALQAELKRDGRFNLKPAELAHWLSVFRAQGLIIVQPATDNPQRQVYQLNRDSLTVRRVLGRRNLYGVILNARRMGATHFNQKKNLAELIEKLQRYVTRNDKDLAVWSIDCARTLKATILEVENRVVDGQTVEYFHHRKNYFTETLDERQPGVFKHLFELLGTLHHDTEGWVDRNTLVRAMRQHPAIYGYLDQEMNYWLEEWTYRNRGRVEKGQRPAAHGRGYNQSFRLVTRDNKP